MKDRPPFKRMQCVPLALLLLLLCWDAMPATATVAQVRAFFSASVLCVISRRCNTLRVHTRSPPKLLPSCLIFFFFFFEKSFALLQAFCLPMFTSQVIPLPNHFNLMAARHFSNVACPPYTRLALVFIIQLAFFLYPRR